MRKLALTLKKNIGAYQLLYYAGLGQSFFIFRFTDPPDPIFWKLKKINKKDLLQFYFFISLRLMPVQYWSSVLLFRFVFSIVARLIKLPPVTAPGEILPF